MLPYHYHKCGNGSTAITINATKGVKDGTIIITRASQCVNDGTTITTIAYKSEMMAPLTPPL